MHAIFEFYSSLGHATPQAGDKTLTSPALAAPSLRKLI